MTDLDIFQQEAQGILGSVPSLVDLKGTARRVLRRKVIHRGVTDAGTAANAVGERVVFTADVPCQLIGVNFTPGVGITGGDTNYDELRVSKRPASAPGTPVIAATVYTTATTPTPTMTPATAVAWAPTPIPLSATAANQQMAVGDVLTFQKLVTASGLAIGAAVTAAGADADLELIIEEL